MSSQKIFNLIYWYVYTTHLMVGFDKNSRALGHRHANFSHTKSKMTISQSPNSQNVLCGPINQEIWTPHRPWPKERCTTTQDLILSRAGPLGPLCSRNCFITPTTYYKSRVHFKSNHC